MRHVFLCLGVFLLFGLAGCSKGTNLASDFTMEHGSSKAIFLEPADQERTVVASWSTESGIDGYVVTAANENEAVKGLDESTRPSKKITVTEEKNKDKHELTFTAKAKQGYALVLVRDINAKGPKTVNVKAEVKVKS